MSIQPAGRNSAAVLMVFFFLGACATAGTTSGTRTSPDKLTRTEITESAATSAYDVVIRLRPDWLNPARLTMNGARVGTQTLLVYVDGVRFGGIESLRSLTTSQITSMEFFTATRAATVVRDIGTGLAGPVIMVSTR